MQSWINAAGLLNDLTSYCHVAGWVHCIFDAQSEFCTQHYIAQIMHVYT